MCGNDGEAATCKFPTFIGGEGGGNKFYLFKMTVIYFPEMGILQSSVFSPEIHSLRHKFLLGFLGCD